MKITISAAAEIIKNHVSDWDPEVLRNAAAHAIKDGNPWTFEGRPEDLEEMDALVAAYDEIKKAIANSTEEDA